MSEIREAGWYWIKEVAISPRWEAAEWCPDFNGWAVIGNEDFVSDENVVEVGYRIPTPGEPWQCVPVEATEDMLDEVCSAEGIKPWVPETMADTYRAMVNAAPKPGGE